MNEFQKLKSHKNQAGNVQPIEVDETYPVEESGYYDDNSYDYAQVWTDDETSLPLDDISDRQSGDFIITFGLPGSGKTTFQWFLSNFILGSTHLNVELLTPKNSRGESYLHGRNLLDEWGTNWAEGRFPSATPADEKHITEMMFQVTPVKGKTIPLKFGFLEMAGELLKKEVMAQDKESSLPKTLESYLLNKNMRFVLVLVIDPKQPKANAMFKRLFDYIDSSMKELKERMSICVLITRPNVALDQLAAQNKIKKDREFTDRDFNEDMIPLYIQTFYNSITNALSAWPDKDAILMGPFSIGHVGVELDKQTQQPGKRLQSKNTDHTEIVFEWVYERFNGFPMGDGFWKKMFDNIRLE